MYYVEKTSGVDVYVASSEPIDDENFVEISEYEYFDHHGIIPISSEIKISPEIKALSDRQDFLEDCIAEMAQVVYS